MIEALIARWKARRRWRFRSSITGHFVSQAHAEANPATTIRERC